MRPVRNSGNSGFTLIELLVVIAIIGMLSSIILASLNSARNKARDARRISDLRQVKNALELYYDANGSYPLTTTHADGGWGGWGSQCAGGGSLAANNVIVGLVPAYMPAFPSDPAMNTAASTNCYLYYSNGTDYKFMSYNIGNSNIAAFPGLVDPLRNQNASWSANPCPAVDPTWAWSVYSPGARCAW
jgi:prepilin-type N-terminal cleavage/methylation domain-containing protein